jgi:hypothetical protein
VLPPLPSNEKNSFDHHNFYNKGPNLACDGFLESPLKFPSTKKSFKKSNYNLELWLCAQNPKIPYMELTVFYRLSYYG